MGQKSGPPGITPMFTTTTLEVTPPPVAPVPRFALNLKEAAASLSVSETTVRKLLRKGRLRSLPGLRHHLIPVTELERFTTLK
jgi:excisionase family DNA binding protein